MKTSKICSQTIDQIKTRYMKKYHLITSIAAIMVAASAGGVSTALLVNPAGAIISTGCVSGTTIEDQCTLTNSLFRLRCTVTTAEGTKDAYFPNTSCAIPLYRPIFFEVVNSEPL